MLVAHANTHTHTRARAKNLVVAGTYSIAIVAPITQLFSIASEAKTVLVGKLLIRSSLLSNVGSSCRNESNINHHSLDETQGVSKHQLCVMLIAACQHGLLIIEAHVMIRSRPCKRLEVNMCCHSRMSAGSRLISTAAALKREHPCKI